jgi:5S rRNA maturation endonuclease (ribonuclease M5)
MLSPEERLQEVMKVLDELEELSKTTPIVVEGLRDVEALRRMGIEKNVVTLGRGSTLFNFCEELSRGNTEAVVLTDWDRKGGRLARTLRDGFEANGVKVIDHVRTRLVILSKKEIKDIESLPTFVMRLRSLATKAEER